MQFECPDRDAKMPSNAVEIFRLPLDCRTNAARIQLERPDQNARKSRINLEWISIAAEIYFDILGTKRIQKECISNAVGILKLPLECISNANGFYFDLLDT